MFVGDGMTDSLKGNQVQILSDPVTVNEEQGSEIPLQECEKVRLCEEP